MNRATKSEIYLEWCLLLWITRKHRLKQGSYFQVILWVDQP